MSADEVRALLAELRELDPANADEVDALWPHTLMRLDEPGAERTSSVRALVAELRERIERG